MREKEEERRETCNVDRGQETEQESIYIYLSLSTKLTPHIARKKRPRSCVLADSPPSYFPFSDPFQPWGLPACPGTLDRSAGCFCCTSHLSHHFVECFCRPSRTGLPDSFSLFFYSVYYYIITVPAPAEFGLMSFPFCLWELRIYRWSLDCLKQRESSVRAFNLFLTYLNRWHVFPSHLPCSGPARRENIIVITVINTIIRKMKFFFFFFAIFERWRVHTSRRPVISFYFLASYLRLLRRVFRNA